MSSKSFFKYERKLFSVSNKLLRRKFLKQLKLLVVGLKLVNVVAEKMVEFSYIVTGTEVVVKESEVIVVGALVDVWVEIVDVVAIKTVCKMTK